ncbi:transcriptional regulator HexR [Roseixanthobacter pseudopolyaromaticivorans]|uniref:transcriptional regulator HexR n=1 Tax=Xanthobacteraceae TaxID=335928 RepID=UPI00372BC259
MTARVNLLRRIDEVRPQLRKSEKKVADLILAAPSPVIHMSIASLSAEVDVSEPTILRFCRAIGCDGFPDFKLKLAQSLVSGTPYVHADIEAGDDMLGITSKVFNAAINTLGSVRERINFAAMEEAVALLNSANRIDVFALGLTSAVGLDAQQKFLRFDIPVVLHMDSSLQTMAAATLKSGDVALMFSYHGQQKELLRTAEVAKASGASIVCVTRTGSRLARIAHVVVNIDTEEDTFIYAPMTTRIAHMAIVDALATGVALQRGPAAVERFKKIKATLRHEQWPEEATD